MTDLRAPLLDSSPRATIRNGALVLSFDHAEKPFVARFDLDSLAQATFEIDTRDGYYYLILKDFAGQHLSIAHFTTKTDAHQALQAIFQALLQQGEKGDISSGACCPRRKSGWRCFFRFLGFLIFSGIFGFLILLALLKWNLASQQIATPLPGAMSDIPGLTSAPQNFVPPAAPVAAPSETPPSPAPSLPVDTVPEGQPADASNFFDPNTPSASVVQETPKSE